MMDSAHPSCLLCLESGTRRSDPGPSTQPPLSLPSRRGRLPRRRRMMKPTCLALTASLLVVCLAPLTSASSERVRRSVEPRAEAARPPSLANLIQRREGRKRAYPPGQILDFQVNVTPPRTCEPMNITFDSRGGVPPFTIFIGFGQWYPYTVSLPASYADPEVSTWFYQFNVPLFRPFTPPSSPTPNSVVVVSDSTGHLMNSSSFQTVVEDNTSCGSVTGGLDFAFFSDPTVTTCQPWLISWLYQPPQPGWKDPVDIFILRERAPPIHIGVTNSSAGSLNYTVLMTPGTNIMLTMTDEGGNGGVSGQNTVGGSEYIGLDCLAQTSTSVMPFSLPSPTTTLVELRMPDYTASVSSVVTSDGVVSTSVALQTYRNGSPLSGSGLEEGSIAGLAVGIGLGAAILAAVLSWCVWRKKHGQRTLLWDIPRSVENELSKRGASGPIDQDYLRNRSNAMSRTGSATAPMLPTMSPSSDTSEDPDGRRRHMPPSSSDNSFADSPHDSSPLRLHQSPPWTSSGNSRRYSNLSSAIAPYSDTFQDGTTASAMTRRGSETSSTASNPFGNTHASLTPSRSYWQPFNDTSGGDSESESMAMTDTRFHSSARLYADASAASLYEPDHRRGGSRPSYVLHSDAGLLLDDSLQEEEDLTEQIELPPQYHSVPRRPGNASRGGRGGASRRGQEAANTSTAAPSGRGEDKDEGDERQFWRSAPDDESSS